MHLWGIIIAIIPKASNAPVASISSRINRGRIRVRGSRNKQRSANAIYFYLGGLNLYPASLRKQINHYLRAKKRFFIRYLFAVFSLFFC